MRRKWVATVLVASCTGLVFSVVPLQPAFADSKEDQKKQELKNIQEEKEDVKKTMDDLKEKIGPKKEKVVELEKKISETNKKIAEVEKKQEKNEENLKYYKQVFKKRLRIIYQNGEMGSMQALFESDSLEDFLERFETLRLIVVRDKTLFNKYDSIRKEHEKLKEDLVALKEEQKKEAKETRKIYQDVNKDIEKAREKLASLDQKQNSVKAELRKLTMVSASLYPFKYASTAGVDAWGFYNRQCTSFVAWRMNQRGINFTNTMRGGRWGNATNWDDNARALGYRVDQSPSVGAIAQWNAGVGGASSAYGHVAYVTGVNGSMVTIEEYNHKPYSFSKRTIPASQVSNFIHIN
ncbi:CHAP domain-containing protein [Paludifilum halophilum]|uniref:Peptidase C51 domain-containing protein n=1 Tax=Paludifilum halophilum TaxID=1642702 RepID=A0A235B7V1_9BACL|nr:CHAP domain-containing protein [Paludifilum halophilum]OYD08390.1 hypothetical protein CHM34_06025 [Paludifilum halophilum]